MRAKPLEDPNSPRPKKQKKSGRFFYDVLGIVHQELIPSIESGNRHFYLGILKRLQEDVQKLTDL